MSFNIIDNKYSFSIENSYNFKSLIVVKTLTKNKLNYLTGDFVYAEKLDGHRGVYIQTNKDAYITFENGRRLDMEIVSSDVFVLDIELLDDGYVVCDVLYYNRPLYDLNLFARLSLVSQMRVQTYYPIREFKEITNAEGYVFLNSCLPYDRLEIFKFKYVFTVDFLRIDNDRVQSSDGQIYSAVYSTNIGRIEELSEDLQTIIRLRDDKLIPNSSKILAQDERVSIEDLLYVVTRRGISIMTIRGDKIIYKSEEWLATNVTENSGIYSYSDDEDEDDLFDFEVMDKDGKFTPEYQAFKKHYLQNKSTYSCYVQAVQPQTEYEEEIKMQDFDAQMLLDEKIIVQKSTGGFVVEGESYEDPMSMHPSVYFDAVPEIREYIQRFFKLRETVFGPLIKCDDHLQRCGTTQGCVRKLLFFLDDIYYDKKLCHSCNRCYKFEGKCYHWFAIAANNRNFQLDQVSDKVVTDKVDKHENTKDKISKQNLKEIKSKKVDNKSKNELNKGKKPPIKTLKVKKKNVQFNKKKK